MRKNTGFSLIEILVTITLTALLAAYSAPSFSRMIRSEQFDSDAEGLFDAISQARSYALANKMCEKDGVNYAPVAWSVRIVDQVSSRNYLTFCIWDEDKFKNLPNISTDNYVSALDNKVDFPVERVSDLHSFYNENDGDSSNDEAAVDGESFFIHFWAGSPQVSIVSTPYTNHATRRNSLRLVIDSVFDTHQTICLNRIQGFPTLNTEGDTCAE